MNLLIRNSIMYFNSKNKNASIAVRRESVKAQTWVVECEKKSYFALRKAGDGPLYGHNAISSKTEIQTGKVPAVHKKHQQLKNRHRRRRNK